MNPKCHLIKLFSLLVSLWKSMCTCLYNGKSVWWWNMYPYFFIPQQRPWYRISFLAFLYLFFLSDCIERERKRGISLQASCQLLGKVSSACFSMVWGMGVCVSVSTAEVLCMLKLPWTWMRLEYGGCTACTHHHMWNTVTMCDYDEFYMCIFLCWGSVLMQHHKAASASHWLRHFTFYRC